MNTTIRTLPIFGFVCGKPAYFFTLADAAAASATGVYVLSTPAPSVVDGVPQWYTFRKSDCNYSE
jgi:hypothetical protein